MIVSNTYLQNINLNHNNDPIDGHMNSSKNDTNYHLKQFCHYFFFFFELVTTSVDC